MFIFDAPGNNIYVLYYCTTKEQGVITIAIFSKAFCLREVPPT